MESNAISCRMSCMRLKKTRKNNLWIADWDCILADEWKFLALPLMPNVLHSNANEQLEVFAVMALYD